MTKIIIGTANFGTQYGFRKYQVPRQEALKILDCALENGIDTIETAIGYKCDNILREFPNQFHYIIKGDYGITIEEMSHWLKPKSYKPMIHHYKEDQIYDKKYWKAGSLYVPIEPPKWMKTIEVPYNILDVFYGKYFGFTNTIIRSVFIQGIAFLQPEILGIPFHHLCWNFAMQSGADAIVVGVDSAQQLRDILTIPKYEVDYANIGDYSGKGWLQQVAR